jgi:hypothetical protein
MSEQAYYFINHTRKEFIFFSKHISIVQALDNAIKTSVGWTTQDDIRIDSEAYNSTSCIEYLDEKRYCMSKLTK